MRILQYIVPHSLDEAIALLEEFGSQARFLAGGNDMMQQQFDSQYGLTLARKIE